MLNYHKETQELYIAALYGVTDKYSKFDMRVDI